MSAIDGFTRERSVGSPSHGWAVKEASGAIIVATVSPTKTAAMVNWLVVRANIAVMADVAAHAVDHAFRLAAPLRGARLVQVEIRELH